jgi:hypothetical protein
LLVAAQSGHFAAMQYLREERGALMTDRDHVGRTVWSILSNCHTVRIMHWLLSSLLKVMVCSMMPLLPSSPSCHHSAPGSARVVGTSGHSCRPTWTAAGRGRHALPLACCAAISCCRVRRHHPGGHVGGRAARASASSQEGPHGGGRGGR